MKGAGDEKPNPNEQPAQVAETEPEKDGQMSEKQAELLPPPVSELDQIIDG